jgi:ferric-dicitrate binding protein FerR (iron transport regulator)
VTDESEERLELEAWDHAEPPGDFAEKVLARIRAEDAHSGQEPAKSVQKSSARRWGVVTGTASALALAAAIVLRATSAAPAQGEAIARERVEVAIGSRALAVLETGAEVRWDGDRVVQARGDVFYRVEPGARFHVRTPAGEIEVQGTCFAVKVRGEAETVEKGSEGVEMQKRDMKAGAVGAALSALSFVAVYEGKVAVSHAGERVELAAGESAELGPGGVRKGDLGEGERAFDAKIAAGELSSAPLAAANENLVGQVNEYKKRLEMIATAKAELEEKLEATEARLASAETDGAAARSRSEWDLDGEDWAELAKKGTVKYRVPCSPKEFKLTPEVLNKMGLAPDDAPVVTDALEKTHKKLWSEVRPLCIQAIGNVEVVDKIGFDACSHLIHNVESAVDRSAAAEAMYQVGEIRAGQRPPPGPNDKVHPVAKLFLSLTSASQTFEAELAKSFGPDEAHRIVYADGMCAGKSTWGTDKRPKK